MNSRLTRRSFFQTAAFAAAAAALHGKTGPEELRGVYPIMQTPFTDDDRIDYPILAKQTKFLDRTRTHGMVWPQLASEYFTLKFDERIKGAETIVEAAQGLSPKVVIGVQATDAATAVKFAKHAQKIRPDAIIAIPPRLKEETEFDLAKVEAYYKRIADACDLPLFVQALGNMSVEFLAKMVEEIPTLKLVKDEAGHTLSRITEFQQLDPKRRPVVFTGGHGRTFVDELERGSAGTMPVASWVELYVHVWDLWHAGRLAEAMDMYAKVNLMVNVAGAYGMNGMKYVLHLRGIFPTWNVRSDNARALDSYAKASIERVVDFVRPDFNT